MTTRQTYPKGAAGDAALSAVIQAIHTAHPAYGARRVLDEVMARGAGASRKRILRLMRAQGRSGAYEPKRPKRGPDYADRHVHRGDVPAERDRVWVGDTTQILSADGWIYVTIWVDLRSRFLVGWALSDTNDARHAIRALTEGIRTRKPCAGLFVHSDRGATFHAADFRAVLRFHGFVQSMSRLGRCHDNASAETFFASMKRETEIADLACEPRETVESVIVTYLSTYNEGRRHTAREGTPGAFERLSRAEQDAILARAAQRAAKAKEKVLRRHAKRRAAEQGARPN